MFARVRYLSMHAVTVFFRVMYESMHTENHVPSPETQNVLVVLVFIAIIVEGFLRLPKLLNCIILFYK